MSLDIDTSWIEKEERMHSSVAVLREPLQEISVFYIYIDDTDSIQRVIKEVEVLDNTGIINKSRLLQMIQTNKNREQIKYKLMDILSFQVDLEAKELPEFVKTEVNGAGFFKTMRIFDEIHCVPSIFLFHEINSIYFVFKVDPTVNLRSILKTGASADGIRKTTKKVRMASSVTPDTRKVFHK